MRPTSTLALVLALFLSGAAQGAERLRLAGVFADHVVLQRERPVPVWGWAEPGAAVRVEFAGQSAQATAGDDGGWSVALPPLAAAADGRPLRVVSGEQTLELQDVLVGEVWHASGQSNMAMTLAAVAGELAEGQADLASADLPAIRFCRVAAEESAEPLADLRAPARWTPCQPATAGACSAAAFYFARRVHAELDVPVGIIDTSRGGTPIEPFIPRAAFDEHPTLRRELALGDAGDLAGLTDLPGGVRARDANWLPGRLFHARLAPLARFAVRGALWYQGESNCGVGEDPRDYQHKLRALIRGWRQVLGNEELSVYVVQLPGSGAGRGWPYLREQQRLAMDLPRTGLAVTIDLDGAGIHPANKLDVGERLARLALARDYGAPLAASGPLFERQEVQGDRIVLHFRYADSGLMTADKDGLAEPRETPGAALRHFEAADESGAWRPAQAEIAGRTVVVRCGEIAAPVSVRYAYAVTPENCNLYNRDGLPAAPFCTRPELLVYK